jgi:hypothetical protein
MSILRPRDKVGLVGTGTVDASFTYALIPSGLANEPVLIDASEPLRPELRPPRLAFPCRLVARISASLPEIWNSLLL